MFLFFNYKYSMGLMNVYSFNKTIRPHMSYRFKVTFFYNKGAEEIESLSYYVKSVELPVWNISTENRLRFGNTQYVIPTFDFGQSTLKIVFMETDNMSISYFLNGFLFNNIENTDMEMNLWNNCAPGILKIKIDELEPSMRGTVISNIYACHLKRLSTPKFGNTSLGTPVEIEAEFVVRYKLNSITTEIGAEPREIKDPDSLRADILEARREEEGIKEKILGINAKMQALAFADVEAKRKQKKDLQTKKKGLEAMLAQKEKERAALEAKINKEGADITALLAKKKQLEAMLALRNKTRKQAGLKPIYGFTEEESAINGFLDQEYINNNVTDAMGIVSIDASILSENGKVDVDELMGKLNQYGIKFNVSRHGDTFENLAAFSSLFTDKELGTIEYISMSKADYEKFDGLSTTDILTVLSDIQSIDQQLAQHERHSRELKQDLKDLESLNNDISSLKSDIAKTDSDISGVDAELREMADTKIYSASESKGEARTANATGTNAQGSNTYRGGKGSVEFNAQTTSYNDGTTMTVLDVTNTSMRGSSYKAFHQDNSGEGQANRDVTIVLHRQAGSGKNYTQNVGQAAHDSISTGAAIYIDDNGNIVANMDRIRQLGSTAAQGKDTRDAIAIEISGAVDIRKGSDGKYYARTVTGKKSGGSDVIFKEISETEAKQYGLYEYDESNSNDVLMSSVNKAKQGTKKAVDANGNIVNVTFTNVYAQGYSQAQLDALQKVGELLRSQGINATGAVSHGMIDKASAKTEGNYITNQQGMKALGFG